MEKYKIDAVPYPPTDASVDEYRTLRLQALATNPECFSSTYARESAYTRETWHDRLNSPLKRVFIARAPSGEAVGLVTIVAPGAIQVMLPTDEESLFPVFGMWMSPAHRGKGVGRRLLEEAFAWAAEHWHARKEGMGSPRVVLEVGQENEAAKALYTAAGLKELKVSDGAAKGSDTVWMVKSL